MVKVFLLFFISKSISLFSQRAEIIKITGRSTFYNNQSVFIQGGNLQFGDDFNDFKFLSDQSDIASYFFKKVEVRNNEFTVLVSQKYPHPFVISYYDTVNNKGYSSEMFFLDKGTRIFLLDDLSKHREVQIVSKSNSEYQVLKKACKNSTDKITGEILNFQYKQYLIAKYLTNNPNSYVALWSLISDYTFEKSKKDKLAVLKNTKLFSFKIKHTKTYQAFLKNISQDLELDAGSLFPVTPFGNFSGFKSIISKNKFTLIDFWFSGCKPCIDQFLLLKIFYSHFKMNHFEIIGISVDREKDEQNRQKIIHTLKLDWIQYVDTGGKEANKLFIRKFPTNFLLDSTGRIVKKDISPEELNAFLEENLKR